MARSAGEFAKDTQVSVGRSRGEIEDMLNQFGASSVLMGIEFETGAMMLQFIARERMVKFVLQMPELEASRFTEAGTERSEAAMRKHYEQVQRQRVRQLKLVLQAKLESVAGEIEEFEQAFLANVVWPDGRTTHQLLDQKLEQAYLTERMAEADVLSALPPLPAGDGEGGST